MDENDWLAEPVGMRAELEEKIERAGSITLDRLHLLVQKGYQPNPGWAPGGAIRLDHPRESFEYKRIILHGSGLITGVGEGIAREETAAFERFLQTVPTPSLWERRRHNLCAWGIIGAVIVGSGLIGWWLAGHIVKALLSAT
jgi:hypothetical protein